MSFYKKERSRKVCHNFSILHCKVVPTDPDPEFLLKFLGAVLPSRAMDVGSSAVYLVRHGQSTWNLAAKRFDLWTMFSQARAVDIVVCCLQTVDATSWCNQLIFWFSMSSGGSSTDVRGRGTSEGPPKAWRFRALGKEMGSGWVYIDWFLVQISPNISLHMFAQFSCSGIVAQKTLSSSPASRIFSSPLTRAVQTTVLAVGMRRSLVWKEWQ